MPFQLKKRDASVEAGLRRIAAEQIDRALATLDNGTDRAEAAHDVRKRCKKLRSLVRLVRPAFPDYVRENAALREAQGRLSGTRDAEAMIECYDALGASVAGHVDRRPFAPIRRRLTERRKALYGESDVEARLDAFREDMHAARTRVENWRLEAEGFDAVEGGVGKTYARGRKAMRAARAAVEEARGTGKAKHEARAAEALHEWRKRVKHHRQHARLLRGLWPAMLDAREGAADDLGDLLGDHHDLAVLSDWLEAEREHLSESADVDALVRLARQRQRALEDRALGLGRRVFAEKPGALLKRWKTYWRLRTAETASAARRQAA